MTVRVRVVLVVVWLTSLLAVGTLARSQVYRFDPLPEPIIVSGRDIAFKVEGQLGSEPAGRWVIRMNGGWIEPEPVPASLLPRPVH